MREKMRSKKVLILAAGIIALLLCGCTPEANQATPSATTAPTVTTATAKLTPSLKPTQPKVTADGSSAVPASAAVPYSYFDDAVFIGDSVSLKLKNYVTEKRQTDSDFMGKAQFLVSGSLGSGNALWEVGDESVHPTYKGNKMTLEESVAQCGAKKVYIMLGLNDIAVYGIEGTVDNMETMIERIRDMSPGVKILIQSATPMTRDGEKNKLNNGSLVVYDNALEELCKSNGYYYIDVASVMRDSEGYLPDELSSDNYVHFTDAACVKWIEYLRTHSV